MFQMFIIWIFPSYSMGFSHYYPMEINGTNWTSTSTRLLEGQVGAQQVGLQPFGGFHGHLHPVLQHAHGEMRRRPWWSGNHENHEGSKIEDPNLWIFMDMCGANPRIQPGERECIYKIQPFNQAQQNV